MVNKSKGVGYSLSEIESKFYSMRDDSDLQRENDILKRSLSQMKVELDKFKTPPLVMCEVKKVLGNRALVKLPNSHVFYVNVGSGVQEGLRVGDQVLAEQKSLTLIEKVMEPPKNYSADNYVIMEKPTICWNDIGGLDAHEIEIREVIEFPLLKPDLFRQVGITPPKGILLHGPPGCGKTLLAKAVANSTNSTFIEIVASELVQKFIGEGAKLVKEIFTLAREKAPSIVFIDEIDALAAERMDVGTSGEREVQRTFMQLLAEIDGFKNLGDVKIIAATNRIDILDKAIIRPGRLDRLIEVGYPDADTRTEVFKVHMKPMNTAKINRKKLVSMTDGYTGAEIKSVCTEAGYYAIREGRDQVMQRDFERAVFKVKEKDCEDTGFMDLFG